ncbi:MAG: hypothetical protein ABSH16_05000 [Sedimentisphaerales bacterium]
MARNQRGDFKVKRFDWAYNADENILPIFERFSRIYGLSRACSIALLLVEALPSRIREDSIEKRKTEGKKNSRKCISVFAEIIPIHQKLTDVYGPKRVYDLGFYILNGIIPEYREMLVSLLGKGIRADEMIEIASNVTQNLIKKERQDVT